MQFNEVITLNIESEGHWNRRWQSGLRHQAGHSGIMEAFVNPADGDVTDGNKLLLNTSPLALDLSGSIFESTSKGNGSENDL